MKHISFKLPKLQTLLFAAIFFVLSAPIFGNNIALATSAGIVLTNYLPMPTNVLGMNNTDNFSALASYERAKTYFQRAFSDKFNDANALKSWVDNLKFSQGNLRLEVQLNAVQNQYTFGVTTNDISSSNVVFNTEKRLKLQDSFCAYEYAVYIGAPSSQTDTTWQLRTYPNTQDFAAGDVTILNSIFYSHGSVEVKCNNDILVPYRGLWNHLYRPETQQTAALGAASPQDEVRFAQDGLITLEPNFVMIGSKANVITINLPGNLTGLAASFARAIIILNGVTAQNSTVVS